MPHLRRFLFAILVFGIAALVFGVIRSTRAGYGLIDLATGKAPPKEQFTAPVTPKLAASDVSLLAQLDDEFGKVAASVLPSVVRINTSSVVQRLIPIGPFTFNGGLAKSEGLGSGAIISKEGHIITNHHVIKDAQQVEVTTNDKKTYKARVIDSSETRDIALLKIDSDRGDFPALAFADSDKSRVGQIVFAVGNPFGLTGTVTQGIISARDRLISDGQLDYLQTDTVINPGNSGGPLVNIRGEILGINVSIYQTPNSTSGGAWQGVGFAIPANEAKQVVKDILELGSAPQKNGGYLGLSMDSIQGIKGVFVRYVYENSPAALAGLQSGDLVLKFNGKPVKSPQDLLQAIKAAKPNSPFTMEVVRGQEIGNVTGTVGTQSLSPR